MLGSLRAAALAGRIIAVLTVTVLAASCSSPTDAADRESKNRTLSFHGCDEVACKGDLDGAAYEVRLPQTWNGTLLIYSHGYRFAESGPPSYAQPETGAKVASTDETATALLSSGYALVGSGFAKNGWAVEDGVRAGEDLYDWFRNKVGQPDRVYVWGDSLGGLITQTLAEKHPEWVTGAAPMCGVLGGLNVNLDLGLDLEYAIKTLLYPQMKLTNFTSHAEAVKTWQESRDRIMAATKDIKNGVPKLLAIQAIVDGPTKSSRFDGSSPTSQVSAMVEAALTGLALATVGRYEIESRVGGNPSTNVSVDYAARVSTVERKIADTIAPGGLAKALAALAKGQRVEADASARRKAGTLGNPTGDLQDPTITLHTAFDPLVLVQNEALFAQRVSASTGRKADLVQLYTQPPKTFKAPAPYGAGHCNFTDDERVGLIHLLDEWVRGGVPPTPETVARAMKGAKGYAPGFTPGAWPAPGIR